MLSLNFNEAEEAKLRYSRGEMTSENKTELEKAFRGDCEVWQAGVELALEDFAQNTKTEEQELLPTRILLCGGGSMLPDIPDVLKTTKWSKSLPFPGNPKVEFILPKDVVSIVDETNTLKDQQDVTPMALANLALDFSEDNGVVESILDKVTEGLKV